MGEGCGSLEEGVKLWFCRNINFFNFNYDEKGCKVLPRFGK